MKADKRLKVFWGEAHDNTYQFPTLSVPMEDVLDRAAAHLDFYAAAYYTSCSEAFHEGGHLSETDKPHPVAVEEWKDQDRLDREWKEVQEATRKKYRPGEFVTFPGYEWQGNGTSGDHNVFAFEEGLPIFRVNTLKELYERLIGFEAIAVPHHTAYRVGRRGHDWSVYDERLTPFAELYSIHGCSETDEEWIGLRQNSHMGPGQGGGTYQDGLDRGCRIGAICSTDNWGDMPGHYGNGRMACLATELTRRAFWEAFKARRVYGVTGDRIQIDFRINDSPMGSILPGIKKRRIDVKIAGSDAIDRIEILKNGQVIAAHCHQGTWHVPEAGCKSRFKIRVEVGWGPRPNELQMPSRQWDGELALEKGSFTGCEPCWVSAGQSRPLWDGGTATFRLLSSNKNLNEHSQNADIFELETKTDDRLHLSLNGLELNETIRELTARSRVLWYRDECVQMLQDKAGIEPGMMEREDVYYNTAYKAKIHRAVPESAYTAALSFEDDTPLTKEANYRIRAEQRNAQRAWSSPIWVGPTV